MTTYPATIVLPSRGRRALDGLRFCVVAGCDPDGLLQQALFDIAFQNRFGR